MQVPDYNGRHRLRGLRNFRLRDQVPAWLRPSTWILNMVIHVAVTVAVLSATVTGEAIKAHTAQYS